MNIFDSIILGAVEGITEFLPISSTAHLLLAARLLGLELTDFIKTFSISIQLGAILAAVVLYRKELWNKNLLTKIIVAFLPTAFLGLLSYKIIKNVFMESQILMISALIVGGFVLIIFEFFLKNKIGLKGPANFEQITHKKAILIGLSQSLAFVPGVSRAGATIFGGLAMGINRATIVSFSFLLAIPTMLAATALDLFKNINLLQGQSLIMWLTGFIVSFLVAMAAIKFLIAYAQKHSFTAFGIYRIIVGVLIWWLLK